MRKNLESVRQDIGHGQCGLIGWIIENGIPKCFCWSNAEGRFDVVSPPVVDGSGQNYFRYLISGIKEFGSPEDPRSGHYGLIILMPAIMSPAEVTKEKTYLTFLLSIAID